MGIAILVSDQSCTPGTFYLSAFRGAGAGEIQRSLSSSFIGTQGSEMGQLWYQYSLLHHGYPMVLLAFTSCIVHIVNSLYASLSRTDRHAFLNLSANADSSAHQEYRRP